MIKLLMFFFALLPQQQDEQEPLTGPIGDTLKAIRDVRESQESVIERVRTNSGILDMIVRNVEGSKVNTLEKIGGIGERIDKFSARFDGFSTRFDQLEAEQKKWWQVRQEERTKRNEADEATKQVLAELKKAVADSNARIAESNPYQSFWRFLTIATVAGVSFLVFKNLF